MTSHPKDLSGKLIEAIARQDKVCKHIHLPVQSGSDAVLENMNRGYTRGKYLGLIKDIRQAIPDIVITTDIIVGFPGETDVDFADTMSLVEEIRFDSAFTFVYSKRKGTKAAGMEGALGEDIKRERIVKLIELQDRITEEKIKKYISTTQTVLAEGVSTRDKNHICGRTDGGKMVNFAGGVPLIGSFCRVLITQAKRTTLFGELIGTGD